MSENWTDVRQIGTAETVYHLQPEAPAAPQAVEQTPAAEPVAPAETVRGSAGAIDAFEQIYRTSPSDFASIAGLDGLSADTRRVLASLLTLSAPAREALVEVLTLPDETRIVILRVLDLPQQVRDVLRVFLT